MPTLRVNGVTLHYTDSGARDQTIVFSHGLLWSGRMFDAQVAALRGRYRCIAYDHRGQGASEAATHGYDMDTLAEDAAALIETLNIGPCHFVGLSMGGFVGLRLAARRPELLRSLVLMETSADPEAWIAAIKFRLLNRWMRVVGVHALSGRVLPIMFGKRFLDDPARQAERQFWREQLESNRPEPISRAVEGVVARDSVLGTLERIQCPTLVLVGEDDAVTPLAKAHRIHERIDGSRLVQIPYAGHSASIEEPAAVNAAIDAFLSEVASAGELAPSRGRATDPAK